MTSWGFLTNHARALIQLARNPRSTVREVASATGVTERAAIDVLHDLRDAGIVHSQREGRRNVNTIDLRALAAHRPWGVTGMEIPAPLIDATLRGLEELGTPRRTSQAATPPRRNGSSRRRRWGFLTSHALCLIYIVQHPQSTVRQTADAVGLTERAAHAILQDLRGAGILDVERSGRRNSYAVNFDALATFRRTGGAFDAIPQRFVGILIEALLQLRPV